MLQAVHRWLSTYERLVKSQKFFSSYLTQEDLTRIGRDIPKVLAFLEVLDSHGVNLIIQDGDKAEVEANPLIKCLRRFTPRLSLEVVRASEWRPTL